MAMIDVVAHKSPDQMCRLAAGVTGPAVKRLVEIDIEHDAAEIEQQRIGGAGGEEGAAHPCRLRKLGGPGNGVEMSVLIQLADSSQMSRGCAARGVAQTRARTSSCP